MFRKCLAGRPYTQVTCATQLSLSVLTLRIPVMCRAHASFRGILNRELPVKTLLSSIAWVFTHTLSLSITQPLQLNPTINTGYKRLNKITIKFWHGIANKTHSCKLQLYRLFPPFNNMSLTFLRNYKYFDMNKF